MAKKIDLFGKTFNTPRTMLDVSSSQPEPFGGIPSGVFAVFAVIILGISIVSYLPSEETTQDTSLTQSQSTYLENILSDRSRTSPTLSTYDSSGFLEIDLKDHLKEEMRVTLGTGSYYYGGWGIVDDMVMVEEAEMVMDTADGDSGAAPNTGSSEKSLSGGQEGVDFSGTNNQEEGVDEADFVKTDGSYIYLVNQGYNDWGVYPSGKVHILEIPEVGDVSYLSNISIEGYPNEMLLVDDKAVVYSNVYIYSYYEEKHPLDDVVKTEFKRETKSVVSTPASGVSVESSDSSSEDKEDTSDEEKEESSDEKEEEKEDSDTDTTGVEEEYMDYEYDYYYRTTSFTKITVLDLTNRSSPQVIRELYIEGSYQTARESGGTAVSYTHLTLPTILLV